MWQGHITSLGRGRHSTENMRTGKGGHRTYFINWKNNSDGKEHILGGEDTAHTLQMGGIIRFCTQHNIERTKVGTQLAGWLTGSAVIIVPLCSSILQAENPRLSQVWKKWKISFTPFNIVLDKVICSLTCAVLNFTLAVSIIPPKCFQAGYYKRWVIPNVLPTRNLKKVYLLSLTVILWQLLHILNI